MGSKREGFDFGEFSPRSSLLHPPSSRKAGLWRTRRRRGGCPRQPLSSRVGAAIWLGGARSLDLTSSGDFENMQTIPLGVSSLSSSRLAYGCWRVAGTWNPSEVTAQSRTEGTRAILAAYEAGYTLFDTA